MVRRESEVLPMRAGRKGSHGSPCAPHNVCRITANGANFVLHGEQRQNSAGQSIRLALFCRSNLNNFLSNKLDLL